MATAVVNGGSAPRRWRLPERLPDLKGKSLTAYTVVWAIVLAFALTNLIAGSAFRMRMGAGEAYTWARLGLYVADDERVFRVSSGEARQAGIHPGDSILGVNGLRTPKNASLHSEQNNTIQDFLSRRDEGDRVQLAVSGPHGTVRSVLLTATQAHAESVYVGTGVTPRLVVSLLAFAFGLTPLILIGSAALLFRRRVDPVAAFLSLAFMIIASLSGSAGSFWSRIIGVQSYDTISQIIGGLGAFILLLALFTFPQGKFEPRWTAWFAVSLPVAILVADVFPDSQLIQWAGNAWIAAALISMIVRYRGTPLDERLQWRWALLGFTTGFAFLIGWSAAYTAYLNAQVDFATDLWSWVIWPITSVLTITLIVGGITLSVLRYRLYDTQAAVSRSAAYGVLTFGFIALFAGAEKLAEIVGERYFEHSIGIAAGAVGAAVAAACVVPLHDRVHRWAERRFQKPLIRLREGLPECLVDLRDTAPVEQIADAVMKRVAAGVRSTREALLLGDQLALTRPRGVPEGEVAQWQLHWTPPPGDHALDCARRDPLFPLRLRLCIETAEEAETIGWLLLGPRPDGTFFGKDEREALAHIAGPIARAIHVAQLREQREAEAERRIGALEALVGSLAAMVRPSPVAT